MFKSVENRSVSQMIVEQIQEMIMSGELKAGDPLPTERALSEMLNVGRPSLREALKALEVMGIVESRQGSGNYITNNVSENFYKPLSLSFKLSGRDHSEILQMRRMIEYYTTVNAASNADDNDIKELRSIEDHLESLTDPLEISRADRRFHTRIAEITGNSLILDTLNSASYLLDSFANEAIRISGFMGDSLDSVYQEHMAIIHAIENHDPEAAFESIRKHLGSIRLELMDR